MQLQDFHPPLGEGIDFDSRRKPEQLRDFRRGGKLRIDDHGTGPNPLHQADFLRIFRVAHPGNGVAHPDLFGDEAAQQIQLVRGGDGNKQIRRGGPRFPEHRVARAVARHADEIQRVGDPLQHLGILLNQHDFVLLPV